MAGWYYAKEGQQQGPITAGELKHLAATGQLSPDDLVFQEGGTQWVEASSVKGLFPSPAAVRAAATAPAAEPTAPEASFDFQGSGGVATIGRSGRTSGRRATEETTAPGAAAEADTSAAVPPSEGFGDVLAFRKMITPLILQVLFWIGVFAAFLGGTGFLVLNIMNDNLIVGLLGLAAIPLAILIWRVYCELLILLFRIYDTLVEIRDQKKPS